MPNDRTMNENDSAGGAIVPDDQDDQWVATVVQYEKVPDECTIHPINASDEELMTCWVTAREGSFVALEEIR